MQDRFFLALYRSNDAKVRAAAIDKLNKAHYQAYGDGPIKDDDTSGVPAGSSAPSRKTCPSLIGQKVRAIGLPGVPVQISNEGISCATKRRMPIMFVSRSSGCTRGGKLRTKAPFRYDRCAFPGGFLGAKEAGLPHSLFCPRKWSCQVKMSPRLSHSSAAAQRCRFWRLTIPELGSGRRGVKALAKAALQITFIEFCIEVVRNLDTNLQGYFSRMFSKRGMIILRKRHAKRTK